MSAKKNVNAGINKPTTLQIKSFTRFFPVATLILIVITSALYFKSLNNRLTTWDDDYYITNNPDIKTMHGDSTGSTIKKIFTSYASGNYHPLTMISLAMDYNKHQLDPATYHITSLIFHILNTLLVFCFIWLLTQQHWVAFITALLFAIHPMHVESIAWASERKDVLYSFFYLAALCTYIYYQKIEKRKALFYVLTFFLFGLAVLSKAMAVSLPIAFFIIDNFLNRNMNVKTILEKIPFIILSFIFGYVAIQAQKSGNAVHIDYYIFSDRFLFTCYGIMMYLWKLIAPFHLSSYYNYPTKLNGVFPSIIYISPVIILGLVFLIYKSIRFGKDVVFGFGFFIITIALVLQILPIGGAIIADRYSYLPYIGLFFIVARGINNLIENKSEKLAALKIPSIAVLVIFIIMCCYLTIQRSKIWQNSITLWENAIDNEKFDVAPLAYKSMATAYYMDGQYNQAILDYDQYVRMVNNNPEVFCDRGMALYNLNKYEEAILDFNKAIQLNPNHLRAYHFRGLSYFNLKKYPETITDFTKALELKPNYPEAHYTRGLAYYYLGKNEEAMKDYDAAIQSNPKYTEAYSNRGLVYFNLKQYEQALKDYATAIQQNPQFANTYYNRALVYDQLKNYEEAIKDYTTTIQLLPNYSGSYYNRALDYYAINKFEPALNDVIKAKQLGYAIDPNFVSTLQLKQ